MFRIEFLKLSNHPQLGTLTIKLSDNSEYQTKSELPYTSVIIGSNGTGKSFILRTIAEIFRQFHAYSISGKKELNLPFNLHLRYKFYHNTYEIITRVMWGIPSEKKRDYIFFKNRPFEKEIPLRLGNNPKLEYEILYRELEYPNKLLVNSIMNNDRFVFKKTDPNSFYQYLGARSTRSTASTKSSVRKTIKHVFNARTTDRQFVNKLQELLTFLEFEKSFKVVYKTKINKLFFSRELTKINFKKYFEYWWDKDFKYSKRQKENPLWSIPYYNNNFKNDEELTDRLITFLNKLPDNKDIFLNKYNSSSKIIEIDLLDSKFTDEDIFFIRHLENLDIINLEGIQVKKSEKALRINEISSGEYHLLITLIGIFANISEDSIVLIDEPEISLHPNWQMRYISFLKKVFANYSTCHFILTTHSHFLVSDLEGATSFLTGLKREDSQLTTVDIDRNTYGWSAEEVLYKIFDVRTTRNHYLELDLRELLKLIAEKSDNKERILVLLNKVKQLQIDKNDPLRLIVEQASQYLNK